MATPVVPAGFTLDDDPDVPKGFTLDSPADFFSGVAQVGASAAAGLGRQAIEGISEIGGLIAGRGPEASVEAAQALTAQLPQVPLGESGQALIQDISTRFQAAPELVKEIVDAVSTLGPSVGESAFQATGSPLLATAAASLPGALEAATGLAGGRQAARGIADVAAGIPVSADTAIARIQQLSPEKREIRSALEEGGVNRDVVEFQLTEGGRVVRDPLVLQAREVGVDDGLTAAIKGVSPLDRRKAMRMVDIKQAGRKNPLIEGANRPSRIAGESLLKRVDLIRDANRKAGKAIDTEARALKGQFVEFEPAVDKFLADLNNLDIEFDQTTRKLDFESSILKGNPAARKLLNTVVDRMATNQGRPDAQEIHKLKRLIDDQVAFGKAKTGLAGDAERVVKDLRRGIDTALDNQFPAYDAANVAYRETISVINEIQSLAGKQMDLSSTRGANAAGQLMRGIMSNNKSSNRLIEAMDEIEAVAARHGGDFKDDLRFQAFFANELDRLFGSSARTGFQGAQEQAAEAVIDSFTTGGIGTGQKLAKSLINRKTGVSEKDKFKVLRDLLKELR